MSATIGTRLYTLLKGHYVGRDEYGNSYYRERTAPKGRREKRWVIYNGTPEPSKIPPHWHGWMHYTTDTYPIEGAQIPKHEWQIDHLPNATGTNQRYVPQGHIAKGGKRAANTADYVAWKPE